MEAIAALVKEGLCKLLVSTNIDGLHRRAGVPLEQIAELHGNCYREVCENCSAEYLRSFSTIRGIKSCHTSSIFSSFMLMMYCHLDGQHEGHYTERRCEKCDGKLKDSIINFGESLPERDFQLASKVSLENDLSLVTLPPFIQPFSYCAVLQVIGSSMRVSPACNMPRQTLNRLAYKGQAPGTYSAHSSCFSNVFVNRQNGHYQ